MSYELKLLKPLRSGLDKLEPRGMAYALNKSRIKSVQGELAPKKSNKKEMRLRYNKIARNFFFLANIIT